MILDANIKILTELKRRLRRIYTTVPIYEGDGGVWGTWNNTIPCFHIYFHETDDIYSDVRRYKQYTVDQKVQVEYISRVDNVRRLYSESLVKRNALVATIELDSRFTENCGEVNPGDDLVLHYQRLQSETVEVVPGVIDIALVYNFSYTEIF